MKRASRSKAPAMIVSKKVKNTDRPTVANVNKTRSNKVANGKVSGKKIGMVQKPTVDQNTVNVPQRGRGRRINNQVNSALETDRNPGAVQTATQPQARVGKTRAAKLQAAGPSTLSTSFQEGEQIFSMTIDATEDQFGHSEDEMDMDVDDQDEQPESSQEITLGSQRSSQDTDEESVKILPMRPEDRLKQIQEIDDEMLEKLTELRDIMSQGGMEKSSQFVDRYLLPNRMEEEPQGPSRRMSAPVPVNQLTEAEEVGQPMVRLPQRTETGRRIVFRRSEGAVNTNYNHRPAIEHSCKTNLSRSAETIYKNAVQKRISSSSEEGVIDTSDENFDFIADAEFQPDYEDDVPPERVEESPNLPEPESPQPGPSSRRIFEQEAARERSPVVEVMTPHQLSARNTVAAENNKAVIFPKTGKDSNLNNFCTTAMMDEEYLVIGAHIDESMQQKITNGEYVDFGKLLPKDKIVTSDEDSRLELVIRNGKTFWLPVTESVQINSFSKWEQAFRIYANIYTSKHPQRSTELIQYNHVIHTISGMFAWDNVYNYDKEFRLHMSKHPGRNWAIILQQAWTMQLKDRLSKGETSYFNANFGNNFGHTPEGKGKGQGATHGKWGGEPCRRFNKERCPFGPKCRYDHRCAYEPCGKFGHSILNCRKLAADRERNNGKKSNTEGQRGQHTAN